MQRTARMVPTGCGALDRVLGGGLASGDVVLVYGEAETGKTSFAIQCAVNAARLGCKTIFVDSDGTFSVRRLSQIAFHDLSEVSPLITLVKPSSFHEQGLVIDRLDEYLTSSVGLVVLDTVTSLYRAEIGDEKETTFSLNRELGRQLACLAQVARTRKVAVLLTSQVCNVFGDGLVELKPVATRVLQFWADVVFQFKPTSGRGVLKVVLEKCGRVRCPVTCYVANGERGVSDYSG